MDTSERLEERRTWPWEVIFSLSLLSASDACLYDADHSSLSSLKSKHGNGPTGQILICNKDKLAGETLSLESLESENECGCHACLEGKSRIFWILLKACLKLNINLIFNFLKFNHLTFLKCWCYVEFFFFVFEWLVYIAWSKYWVGWLNICAKTFKKFKYFPTQEWQCHLTHSPHCLVDIVADPSG